MYEMLTGKRAFTGGSQASIIAAVLASSPEPVTALQPAVPAALERVIATCLAKDPEDRWQTMRDLLRELRWIAQSPGTPDTTGEGANDRRRFGWPWIIGVAVTGMVAAVAGWIASSYLRPDNESQSAVRFAVSPPPGMSIGRATPGSNFFEGNTPVIAPDGHQLAFVATDSEGKAQLFVRRLDALEPTAIAGTEGAARPFWSPDGRFLAFFADGKLKKIDTRGGRPLVLADAAAGSGGTWNAAGVILFAPTNRDALYRVADTGGAVVKVTSLDAAKKENAHLLPNFLPDGEHFLYLVLSDDAQVRGTYVSSLGGESPVQVINGRYKATYAEPGYLLFVRDATLFAHAFDARARRLAADSPAPLVDSVVAGAFSASATGVLAFHSLDLSRSQLAWFDRQGSELGRIPHLVDDYPVALSPDGERVAVIRNDPQTESRRQDIWLLDLKRDVISRFTSQPADDCCPAWSPDGGEIAFSSDPEGPQAVYRAPATGLGSEQLMLKSKASVSVKHWSPDGSQLLVSMSDDLWLLPLRGDPTLRPLVQGPGTQSDGKFSPDGRWVAYTSTESGHSEIYLTPSSGPRQRWLISTTGAYQPRWRADGREVYYVTADSRLMAVGLTLGEKVEVARPRLLFRTRLSFPGDNAFMTRYDVAPDGRFLLNVPMRVTEPPVTVVLNWRAALNPEK